jgi:multicomponent K+:H+ antiporter subunit G
MSHAADLPLWAALLVALLLVLGSGLTLLGAVGLVRLDSFYKRVHSPTLGTTWGTGGILLGSMLFFSMIEGRPVLHELLIAVFVTVTRFRLSPPSRSGRRRWWSRARKTDSRRRAERRPARFFTVLSASTG